MPPPPSSPSRPPRTPALRAAVFIGRDHAALLVAVVGQAWLMVLLAFAVETPAHRNPALDVLGLPLSLLASAAAALGLAGFAVALHDVSDRRHDRVVAPAHRPRPVASGRVTPRAAGAAGLYALLGGLLAAGFLGPAAVRIALAVAAGILFYGLAGRFIPSVAVLLPALLHALAMGIPNSRAAFLWPVMLTFTHVAVAEWLLWRRGRGARTRPGIHLPAAGLGWGFWCLLLFLLATERQDPLVHPAGWALIGPALAFAAFLAFAITRRPGPARRLRPLTEAALAGYAPLWLFACGQITAGGIMATLLALILGLRAAFAAKNTPSDASFKLPGTD